MEVQQYDENTTLMLDGNAIAGVLHEIFAVEMTVAPAQCASCGRTGEMGSLLAFTHGPGMVLRCPTCHSIVLRIVQAPGVTYIDARGAAYLSIPMERT
jgi:hypothetical protein